MGEKAIPLHHGCSNSAQAFSDRLSPVVDDQLRMKLRDEFERECERRGHYCDPVEGTPHLMQAYNQLAERQAYDVMKPRLEKLGL